MSETSIIRVTVKNNGNDSIYEDWQVKSVERKSEDITSFKATLTSKQCNKQQWSADSTVKVEIFDEKDSDKSPLVLKFKVSKYKKMVEGSITVYTEKSIRYESSKSIRKISFIEPL